MVVDKSPTTAPLLQAQGLYQARDQGLRWILEDVSLEVSEGELVHLKGDNGSGKSTLLEVLSGQRLPVRGQVRIEGSPLGTGPLEGRQHLVFVPDALLPSPWLGPREYLELRASWRGLDGIRIRERLPEVLERWNLGQLAERPIEALSFGEKRRVVLAAADLLEPRLLLLDEPTNGLDRQHRAIATEFLAERSRNSAILVTTHVERQDLPGTTRTLVLEGGRIQEVSA